MHSSIAALVVIGTLGGGLVSGKLVDVHIRAISYNIRWATPSPGIGEALWSTPELRDFGPPGGPRVQEVVERQLTDIQTDLGESWAHIGVGRDGGAAGGEFSPILYRPGAWELARNRTYWLSETPGVPSRGWDAALPRIVTVAQFRHRRTGAPLVFMCTHFDHVGQVARENSAKLLAAISAEWEAPVSGRGETLKTPVLLAGDLNIQPDNPAYLTLVAPRNMHDVKDLVPRPLWHGNTKIYTAFTDSTSDDTRIDHIFVRDPAVRDPTFNEYAVLANRFEDGLFISDHRPVVVDVLFPVNGTCAA